MSKFSTRLGPGLIDWSENLPGTGRFRGTTREPITDELLWKTNDRKANKDGPRHMMYWVGTKPLKEDGTIEKTPYFIKETYQGQWMDNMKHDYGVQTYKNGDRYEGQWLNDKRHGEGVLWVKVPGTKTKFRREYTGGWSEDKRSGAGTCYYPNADRYEGQWLNGMRHGQGSMRYVDGDVYEGNWLADNRHGYGSHTRANGDVYQGSWEGDLKEGFGALYFFSSGRVLVGEWAAGVMKTGVFTKAEPAPGEDKPTGKMEVLQRRLVKIQKLELAEPGEVLRDSLQEARVERLKRLHPQEYTRWLQQKEAAAAVTQALANQYGLMHDHAGEEEEDAHGEGEYSTNNNNAYYINADGEYVKHSGTDAMRDDSTGAGQSVRQSEVGTPNRGGLGSLTYNSPNNHHHHAATGASPSYPSPPSRGMAAMGMRVLNGGESPNRR